MTALILLASAALAATGGPDSYGYTYIDSSEPDGPVFVWTDISSTGTDTALDDDGEYTLTLPFAFYFYGGAFTEVTVGDGAVVLGGGSRIDNRNQCIPGNNSDGDDAMILPLWDDLNVEESPGGGVFWQVLGAAPERQVVIQYEQVPHYGGATLFAFQVILEETTSAITLQYAQATGDDEFSGGASASVGIQADRYVGLEYSCETDALSDGLAIRFDVACDDLDGDGVGACDGDCDDADPAIGPHASETDDGADNDCDGLVDEDWVAAGDVVITEMMPDSAVSDDETGEWFELHNASARSIDLLGWQLADSSDSVTIDEHVVLEPGGYALFAAEPARAVNGNLPPVDWAFDWSIIHLNNAGDALTVSMGGVVIDDLAYTPGPWEVPEGRSMYLDPGYADAVSNDSPLPWCGTPGIGAYDYGGLGIGDYGTPGAPNPAGLCCHDDDGDGWDVCDGDCDDADPARFPGNPEVQDLVDNDCDDVADEDWLEAGSIVITEFMDEPGAVEQELGEWFELTNVGATAVNLRSWRIADAAGEGFDIEGDLIVEAGERLIFAVEGDAALNGDLPVVDYVYPYALFPLRSYDDDDIQVLAGGELMDGVSYRNVPPWDSQPGRSHYLCPGATDVDANDEVAWWGTTPEDEAWAYGPGGYGSPGASNPGDIDVDGDGVALCDGDCDDADPAVGPGAAEDCDNGLDDDCDGALDDEDEDCQPQDSEPPVDDTDHGDSEPPDQEDDEGCGGCASGGRASPGALLLVGLALVGVRRRGGRV
jgi:hypothetical protein